MLGKMVGGVLGARIAERAGRSGVLGGAAGFMASRFIRRSPIGALLVGGAWVGHKLYQRGQERKMDEAARNAKPAKVVEPDAPGANEPVAPEVPPLP